MKIVGRVFDFENKKVKVLANNNMDIVLVENVSGKDYYNGDIEVLSNVSMVEDKQ